MLLHEDAVRTAGTALDLDSPSGGMDVRLMRVAVEQSQEAACTNA